MEGPASQQILFDLDGTKEICYATCSGDAVWQISAAGSSVRVSLVPGVSEMLRIGDVVYKLKFSERGDVLTIFGFGQPVQLTVLDPLAPPRSEAQAGNVIASPIPGRVTRVLVSPGDVVVKNTALIVVEAMKMEITLAAPSDGIIKEVRCAAGDMVDEGRQLVTFSDE